MIPSSTSSPPAARQRRERAAYERGRAGLPIAPPDLDDGRLDDDGDGRYPVVGRRRAILIRV